MQFNIIIAGHNRSHNHHHRLTKEGTPRQPTCHAQPNQHFHQHFAVSSRQLELINVTKHLWLKCDKICQNTSLGKIFDQQLLQEMPEFCTSWVVGRCLNNFLDVTNFCPLSSSAFPLPSQNSNICSHVN